MAKGWLDNYGKQENYNNSKTSVPEGFEGDGYNTKGRNYSPAWGGQFQMGGKLKSNIPVIEDAGGYNEEGYWVPDWEAMTAQAKKLGAKRVKTKHGSLIVFDDNWEVIGVDDNTDAMQMGGNVYPVNYVPQAQNGKLTFLQPTSDKLPEGYRIPYADPSSELAMSIGGEDGEPSYLIPSFKYGKPLYSPIEEFKKTGEHLGGPFKTWQEADEWERTVRHPYVEQGKDIPLPIKTWGEMAMGGSIPGAVGFSYARTQSPAPSNGKYAKKTMPSAKDGGWLDGYDKAQNGKKKFKLKDERLQAIKPSESTFVKKPNFDAEQAKVQKTYVNQVGKQMAEEKRRAKLTKDQREREDYNARNEERGSIQAHVPESTWERTKAIVSNPLTAFGYAARNESLPTRFQFGPRNEHDYALDWVNPLQGAAALSEIPGELGRGEFLNAGLSALDAADLGVYARGAKQLKNINPEGKIFNGLNKQLDDIAIKNTEKYMAKRTPSNTPLSKEMKPQLLDNFDPGEYTPFQEDDYMKWFNEQKNKLNPRPVKQDPRSIVRRSSVIDINDMKEGGVIKDDMGQWDHPGEITEIGSNQITMQGVPYPVLGISDEGDIKLMKPGKNYKFKGKKVTEFPMAKNGLRQEQKGLVNLDQLTNFTNYNKPQPGKWLNKYN